MTVYAISLGNKVKIGVSSNADQRVTQLLGGLPDDAVLLGTMPGGPEIEAHLHRQMEAYRAGGEWFRREGPVNVILDTLFVPYKAKAKRWTAPKEHDELAGAVRSHAGRLWPEASHLKRIEHLATFLGLPNRRVRSIYYSETYKLEPEERHAIKRIVGARDLLALWSARESRQKLEARRVRLAALIAAADASAARELDQR